MSDGVGFEVCDDMRIWERSNVGVTVLYQWSFVATSIVTEFEFFFVARHAQWRACWALVFVCGCAYPLPCHFCWNVFPTIPNTTSLGNA